MDICQKFPSPYLVIIYIFTHILLLQIGGNLLCQEKVNRYTLCYICPNPPRISRQYRRFSTRLIACALPRNWKIQTLLRTRKDTLLKS